jgi:DNA helicase-2/ATP-dependent DNA helicase PcrA
MEWNREQKQAIDHETGPALISAGPGSGKTAVIVAHVKALLEKGVPGRRILVLTFTRAAAAEMEARFRSGMETDGADVSFGTFHSLCFRILREEAGFDRESLVSEKEKRSLMKETLFCLGLLKADSDRQISRLLDAVSRKKGDAQADLESDGREEMWERIFFAYVEKMREEKRLDFEDLLWECRKLLQEEEEVRRRWQGKWRHILIDEYQDLNRVQAEIARILAGGGADLFAVGDEDQAIYGFRGADPGGMLDFVRYYPQAAHVRMEKNYRSVPEILTPAGRLIAKNRARFSKKVQSARPSAGEDAVQIRCFCDEEAETLAVVREIRELHEKGMEWDEMAVLYRSASAARGLLRRMETEGVPISCRERSEKAPMDWMIEDMQAYRCLAQAEADGEPWPRGELLRILNRPDRGLPRTGLEEKRIVPERWLTQFRGTEGYEQEALGLYELVRSISRMDFYAGMTYLWYKAGYQGYVREQCEKRGISWREAGRVAEAWRKEQEISQAASIPAGVSVMTMHASKGLEFRAVFLPGLNEGEIPHGKSASGEALEEERRLMYVAVTRAKDVLYLSWTQKRYHHRPEVSRFLKEMFPGQKILVGSGAAPKQEGRSKSKAPEDPE